MSSLDDKLQRGLIITDDISPSPILDFDKYRNTITKIIKESYPKFSIGIYGDWGSGKTTLMQSIYEQLEKENKDKENPIILVWFNAWRYEREEHFTIIPLLKTIESKIIPVNNKYKTLKQSFKEAGIFGLKISKDVISGIVGNYFGKEASNLTKDGISDFIDRVIPNLEKLDELEKITIYFEGQEKIERQIKSLREKDRYFRIVVFVDDLDRCSPEKVIEVFESIKIFLGLDGFIYVLGLSQKKISQAIKKKYEFDKEEEGDHYLKKIIQIPISLPEWNDKDVTDLLNDFLEKNIIDPTYQDIIKNNIPLILTAVEFNPREVKRFLNNFIVAYEIFFFGNRKETIFEEAKNMLVIQAIQVRWNSFYYQLIKYGVNFCFEIQKYIDFSNEERMKKLDSEDKDEKFNYDFKVILRNYKSNTDLWRFLKQQEKVLFNIKDFSQYRRAVEATKDVSVTYDKFQYQSRIETIALLKEVVSGLSDLKTLIDSNHLSIDPETEEKIMEGFSVLAYIQSSNAYSYANDLGRIMTILEKIFRSIPTIISTNKEKLTKENEDWLSRYQRRLEKQVINDLYEINHIV